MNKNGTTYLVIALLLVGAFMVGRLSGENKYLKSGEVAREQAEVQAEPGEVKSLTVAEAEAKFLGYAKEIEVDITSCLQEGKFAKAVIDDTAETNELGINGTPSFLINGEVMIGAQPFSGFEKVIEKMLTGGEAATIQDGLGNDLGPIAMSKVNELMNTGAAVKGEASAPVKIVEFTDYQCPFCSRYANDTYLQIVAKYIDTGKVQYVLHDLSLPFHSHAQKAAEAARCAGEEGKYWEIHNKLFENQAEWGS